MDETTRRMFREYDRRSQADREAAEDRLTAADAEDEAELGGCRGANPEREDQAYWDAVAEWDRLAEADREAGE